jgi:phosphoadenosine phosphosulfate reductase
LRKVEPMRRALSSVDCWLAGVRREDSASRANTAKFGWDKRFELWKLNPLADWTERDVWNYIHEHDLPYNPLHDQGYPSIGCTHCTKPVGVGGSSRDGRWAGLEKTECGIN